jgi:hypothetical protein
VSRIKRYQVTECVEINAPIERVFAVASDPEMVPIYAPEVVRIEVVEPGGPYKTRVHSHLRIAGLTFRFPYRYHYRPPVLYSGVEEGGRFIRGYFSLRFAAIQNGTLVSHTEGIISPVPLMAWAAGFTYYRIAARGSLKHELERLKKLVEA